MVTDIQYRIYYKYAPISHLGLVQMNQGLFDYLLTIVLMKMVYKFCFTFMNPIK